MSDLSDLAVSGSDALGFDAAGSGASDLCGGRVNAELRPAARILLIDDADRVLLMCVSTPDRPDMRLWITPGGGLDPGETREQAALRELYEETGLSGVELGPCIWKRRHVWQWDGKWVDADEWFYLLRTPAFDAAQTAPDEWEMQYVRGLRWWSLAELVDGMRTEMFAPRRLPELVGRILAGDVPAEPVDVGA